MVWFFLNTFYPVIFFPHQSWSQLMHKITVEAALSLLLPQGFCRLGFYSGMKNGDFIKVERTSFCSCLGRFPIAWFPSLPSYAPDCKSVAGWKGNEKKRPHLYPGSSHAAVSHRQLKITRNWFPCLHSCAKGHAAELGKKKFSRTVWLKVNRRG